MPTGLATTLMLDVAASHMDDRRRGARNRAQIADVRRGRAARRRASRAR
ncbi:MAG TPA: hypothetical protein VFG63_04630 [Nocardioidaceae bacterium]|nr:hypothetical protein [Nocardioidaceae bacterium]